MKYDVYGAVENIDKLAAGLRLSQSVEGKWAWIDGDTDTTEYLDSHNMPEEPPVDIQEITRQIARQYS